MTKRPAAPLGAPCWIDLWTPDVEGSRNFYCELFGWEAGEPNAAYGGYFMFTLGGLPIAGASGDTAERRATNRWKPYFATDDVERTLERAVAHGAAVQLPPLSIEDLGSQAVVVDVAGAETGIWQPGGFAGFTVIHEPGTPSFIAIDVEDYEREVAFYRSAFGWDPVEEESDGHHYAGYLDPENGRPISGIGDETESLTPGERPYWSIFFQCDDVDASVASVIELGGSLLVEPADGGLGRAARVTDPAGAPFWLFRPRS